MINLMRSDLYRLAKCKNMILFWIFIIILNGVSIIFKDGSGISIGLASDIANALIETPKLDMNQATMNFNFYYLFIFPVYDIIAAEFSEKTIKNTISSGISKKLYYSSKYVLSVLFCTVTFVFVNVMYYVVNLAVNGEKYASDFGEYMKVIGLQTVMIAAIISAFVMAAFLFMKAAAFNSVVIIFPIAYSLVEMVLFFIKPMKKFAINYMAKYDISNTFSLFAGECSQKYITNCMLLGAGMIVLSFALGLISFKGREVK